MHPDFASDNYAGVCPEAMAAMVEANDGYRPAYGEDDWTQRAADALRETFDIDCDVYFVFNGTAANALALASCCQSYHAIICHRSGHVETDECGAAEYASNGAKLLLADGAQGKIDPGCAEGLITLREDIHYPRARVLSCTQLTEMGTVYAPKELSELGALAERYGMAFHVDGARFANAVASLDVHPSEISWKVGVDVLCLGGTKMGMAIGEAVIFFDRELGREFAYRCKQAGQLASKMRFLAAPWCGMLADGAWLRHARHANACAGLLTTGLNERGVDILYPVEGNEVFVSLAERVAEGLRARGWHFYSFIGRGAEVSDLSPCRFVCSWNTRKDRIASLLADIDEIS